MKTCNRGNTLIVKKLKPKLNNNRNIPLKDSGNLVIILITTKQEMHYRHL
jgi:hypothetical protein